MGLETGTYISDLNSSNPVAGDPVNEGDDHLRLIKSTVKATFPSVTGAVITTLGTAQVSKAVTADANVDITGVRNLTCSGTITIGSNTATTIQAVYPVGSIYINAAVSTNPATLLGFGTWAAFGAGRVIVGLNASDSDFDTAQETGGAKTHTLTVAEIPSHTHTSTLKGNGEDENQNIPSASDNTDPSLTMTTDATGGGGAHNNLQPYIVAYMWSRTA